jgi:hypothetical protein
MFPNLSVPTYHFSHIPDKKKRYQPWNLVAIGGAELLIRSLYSEPVQRSLRTRHSFALIHSRHSSTALARSSGGPAGL